MTSLTNTVFSSMKQAVGTEVKVLNKEGVAEKSGDAKRILTLLYEQLK